VRARRCRVGRRAAQRAEQREGRRTQHVVGDLDQGAHVAALVRIARAQFGLDVQVLEVLEDGHRLRQHAAVVQQQRRHLAGGIDRPVLGGAQPAGRGFDRDRQVLEPDLCAHARGIG